MFRKILPLLTVGLLVSGLRVSAQAYPIAKGTWELRPSLGALANLGTTRRQETQVQLGLDAGYTSNGRLSYLIGTWVGFGDEYVGFELHLGLKYRFLKLHPRVAPYVVAGLGFTVGLTPPTLFTTATSSAVAIPGSADPLFGFGARVGAGLDYFLTDRILPGFQLVFDLGYRLAPGNGFLGSAQISAGVTFLL